MTVGTMSLVSHLDPARRPCTAEREKGMFSPLHVTAIDATERQVFLPRGRWSSICQEYIILPARPPQVKSNSLGRQERERPRTRRGQEQLPRWSRLPDREDSRRRVGYLTGVLRSELMECPESPSTARVMAAHRISPKMFLRFAPRAMRTPISLVRRARSYDITP